MSGLSASNLSYSHGPEGAGVVGVSLDFPPGQLVALLGANGAGKSTLLKLLAGVLDPQQGSIEYDGRPLTGWDRREYARRVGYLSQEIEIAFPMTAWEVALSGRAPYLGSFGWESDRDLEAARVALDLCEASLLASRPMSRMSGGERKRVLLARVLAGEPEVILLDEPLAALDLAHIQSLLTLLRDIVDGSGRTVVYVSHDPNWAIAHADRVIVMRDGRIVADGAPSSVITTELLEHSFGFRGAVVGDGRRKWIVPGFGLAEESGEGDDLH